MKQPYLTFWEAKNRKRNQENKKMALITAGTRGIGFRIARGRTTHQLRSRALRNASPSCEEAIAELQSTRYRGRRQAMSRTYQHRRAHRSRTRSRFRGVVCNSMSVASAKDSSRTSWSATEESLPKFSARPLTCSPNLWSVDDRTSETREYVINISSNCPRSITSINHSIAYSKAMATKLWATRLGEFNIPY